MDMGIFNKRSSAPQVIDLRDHKDEISRPQWGSPVPCPSCSGRGYLDHIDPYKEIMYLHCTDCFAKYERTRAQMESAPSAF
jgi:hypothetical protein